MFKHILVPTDGSDLSRSACERAVAFAKSIGADGWGYDANEAVQVAIGLLKK